jgi:hypothetical protein
VPQGELAVRSLAMVAAMVDLAAYQVLDLDLPTVAVVVALVGILVQAVQAVQVGEVVE